MQIWLLDMQTVFKVDEYFVRVFLRFCHPPNNKSAPSVSIQQSISWKWLSCRIIYQPKWNSFLRFLLGESSLIWLAYNPSSGPSQSCTFACILGGHGRASFSQVESRPLRALKWRRSHTDTQTKPNREKLACPMAR